MKHYNVEIKENNSISKLLNQIAPSSRVLEFGCANGHMTKYMSQELGCVVCIVEYDMESYNIAKNYAAEGICSDIMDFKWLTAFQEKFDYVIFADVLEHLSDPLKVIESCKDVLKDEGSLLVSIPNIGHNDIILKLFQQKFEYTDIGLLDNTHIHFFAYDGLKKFFEDGGFTVRKLDSTFVKTGYTEQFNGGTTPFKISNSILNKLQERESGEIYQFIVCAQKSETVLQKNELDFLISKIYREGKIYIDRGNGFTEEDVEYVNAINIDEGRYKCECTISNLENITALRYDPIEGQHCIITHCSIKQNGKELTIEYSSNLAGNTGVILFGPDPLIVARTDDDKNEISLQIEYIVESETFTEEVLHNFQDKQNAYLKSDYDADVLRGQLDEANRKIIECSSERNEIVSILQSSLDDCRRERDITITVLQKNIDNYEREREVGLENIKRLETELENIKKEKDEELENIKRLELELENIKKEKDEELNIIRKEKSEELENIIREKNEELDIIRRENSEELEFVKREQQKELENIQKETELLFSDFQSISEMKDRQIKIMNKEMQKQKEDFEEIAVYKEKCSLLEARINKMEHTMSWRITKGLRILGSKLQIK